MPHGQKTQNIEPKKYCNRFNKDLKILQYEKEGNIPLSLFAKLSSMCFIYIDMSHLYRKPCEIGTIIISILQMKKQKYF